jgi:PhzF family phenazine biosynthesis protein
MILTIAFRDVADVFGTHFYRNESELDRSSAAPDCNTSERSETMNKTKPQFKKVHAFTNEQGIGGNLAGVVLEAEGYSKAERQRIAAELGFSETAFHSVGKDDIDQLEFFTPTKQIAVCGHATVATFGVLSTQRNPGEYLVRLGESSTTVRISENKKVGLRQHINFVDPVRDLAQNFKGTLKDSLTGLPDSAILSLTHANVGVSYFVIQVAHLSDLQNLRPNFPVIEDISRSNDLIGYYVFAKGAGNNVHARMFAPFYGIPEEAATGMGAGCLAVSLSKLESTSKLRVHQGEYMTPPSPSLLETEVVGDHVWIEGSYKIES